MSRQGRAAVYMAIACRLDVDGICFPAIPQIAADAGVSEPTAKNAKRWLLNRGLIQIEHRAGTSNRYRLRSIFTDGRIDGFELTQVGQQSYPGNAFTPVTDLPGGGVKPLPGGGVTDLPTKDTPLEEHQLRNNTEGPAAPVSEAVVPPPVETSLESKQSEKATATSGHSTQEQIASNQTESDKPASSKTKSRKANRSKPSDQIPDSEITKSIESLIGWLCYGTAGAITPASKWSELQPSNLKWFEGGLAEAFQIRPDASQPQVAAFAWAALQLLRSKADLPIIKPDVKRDLIGHPNRPGILGSLYSERGAAGVFKLIETLIEEHDAVLAGLRWMSDGPPILDARFIKNKAVIKSADSVDRRFSQPNYSGSDADDIATKMEQHV